MSANEAQRPTRAEIHLDHLAFNFRSVKKFINRNIKFLAVVKADAYGHGARRCAAKLESVGVDWFGTALPEEGLELRESGIKTPILCLGGFWAGQENILLEHNLTPVIYRAEQAKSLDRSAKEKNLTAAVHVKIDTGMGRIGVRFDEVKAFVEELKKCANLRVEGVMTHFAAADDLSENDFTHRQIKEFEKAFEIFQESGFHPRFQDLANSPGAIAHESSRKNLVRLGGVLYGLGGDVLPKEIETPELKPVMSLHTRVAHLKIVPEGETLGYSRTFKTEKDSLIATVPIGYDDGYSRALSNRGRVIVNGKFAPVVGRVSMDWTILDVSDVPDVKVNDEVILIGKRNDLEIKAEDLACLTGTISYEITCGISRRVPRKYVESQ